MPDLRVIGPRVLLSLIRKFALKTAGKHDFAREEGDPMSDAVATETLRSMYLREAVTEMLRGGRLREWTGEVGDRLRRAWDAAIHNLEFDGAMHRLPQAWIEPRERSRENSFTQGPVQVNPFKMDALDCIRMISSFDSDQAKERSDVGPGKVWSPETHRLFAQAQSKMRMSGPDIETVDRIIGVHLVHIARHIADVIDANPREIHEILGQRYDREEFTKSSRMENMQDDSFDFRNETFMWAASNATRVHIPFGRDQAAYLHLFQDIRNKREYRGFYTKDRHLIDVHATRQINGVEENYQSLRFPREPELAKWLIEIAQKVDRDAIVCVSMNTLANGPTLPAVKPSQDRVAENGNDASDNRPGWKP
jgi:hypothetical protein